MNFSRKNAVIITGSLLVIVMFSVWFYACYLSHKTYLTPIQESVSGLMVGSRVEYNGVVVGKVSRIQINPNNARLVDVLLRVDRSTPITGKTVAMLAVNEDDRGKPFIALQDQGDSVVPLKVEPGQSYFIIPSVPSTKANANVSLTQIANSLQQFNETFQAFLTKDDIESFRQLLYSMQQVMGMMSQNSQRLNEIIVNTAKASHQFKTIMSSGQMTLQTLQSQTLPTTYRLMSDMEDLLRKVDALMADIQQNPAVILRGKAPLPPGPGE